MSHETPSAWSRTASDLLAEILMAATNHAGSFLVVEGPSDERFLGLKVGDDVYFVQAGGKETCINTVRILNSAARQFPYLVIADEDYDWIQPEREPNLILTDTRDIEAILLRSSALDALMLELGDKSRMTAFLQHSGTSIRDAVLSRASFFGRVRTLGFIKSICMKSIKPSRFCQQDWTYDVNACAQACVLLGLADNVESLMDSANALNAPSDWHFARGHDLIDILIGGFVHVFSGKAPMRDHVEALLRQSMQRDEFEATHLYRRVSEWEASSAQRIWKAA